MEDLNDSKRKIRVYIADNTDFRNKFLTYFDDKEDFEILGWTDDGQKAVVDICSLKPDLVLLECILPNLDGFAVMNKLVEKMGINLPNKCGRSLIIILSHYNYIIFLIYCQIKRGTANL